MVVCEQTLYILALIFFLLTELFSEDQKSDCPHCYSPNISTLFIQNLHNSLSLYIP